MLDNLSDGFKGEEIIRDFLKNNPNIDVFFQGDIIYRKIDGKWFISEVKHQEKFESPPFDGHGLPPWQIKHRLLFEKERGVIAMLYVIEKGKKENGKHIVYWNYLNKLNQGKHFDTMGDKPRRVFPLENFNKLLI